MKSDKKPSGQAVGNKDQKKQDLTKDMSMRSPTLPKPKAPKGPPKGGAGGMSAPPAPKVPSMTPKGPKPPKAPGMSMGKEEKESMEKGASGKRSGQRQRMRSRGIRSAIKKPKYNKWAKVKKDEPGGQMGQTQVADAAVTQQMNLGGARKLLNFFRRKKQKKQQIMTQQAQSQPQQHSRNVASSRDYMSHSSANSALPQKSLKPHFKHEKISQDLIKQEVFDGYRPVFNTMEDLVKADPMMALAALPASAKKNENCGYTKYTKGEYEEAKAEIYEEFKPKFFKEKENKDPSGKEKGKEFSTPNGSGGEIKKS